MCADCLGNWYEQKTELDLSTPGMVGMGYTIRVAEGGRVYNRGTGMLVLTHFKTDWE